MNFALGPAPRPTIVLKNSTRLYIRFRTALADRDYVKKWVQKLIQQFDFEWSDEDAPGTTGPHLSDDRATLLYLIDTFNKHLIEVEGHPIRKVRETLDEYACELIKNPEREELERVLFRFRQFISSYRIDECAYFQKTFEDFRTIIWEFVDQLAEDIGEEQKDDFAIRQSLEELKEAVESNSIPALKNQSRKFIDFYIEKQFKKDKRRNTRMKTIRQNLNVVKKQLNEVQSAARVDHLTQAFNRKTFDEYCTQYWKISQTSEQTVSMLLVDIDHFKKINDTFGHQVGDFVLQELVTTLKSIFHRESDLLARIGGEEFAILLPDHKAEHALKKAEEVLALVRKEVYVHEDRQIRFTVSIGVAELSKNETVEEWMKRADLALYHSKNNGRNRLTVAPKKLTQVA